MDIIDIMLAKALTPQGQVETYAAKARKAAQDASAAVSNAQTAIQNINSITAQTEANSAAAADTLERVETALANLESAASGVSIQEVDTEIKKVKLQKNSSTGANVASTGVSLVYPDNSKIDINDLTKLYSTSGENTDGAMTQKATKLYVENALTTKADVAALSTKADISYVTNLVNNIQVNGGGSGPSNLGPENAGMNVVVGEDGTITSGIIPESSIIDLLLRSDSYTAIDAIGLEVDYENKSFSRIQEAQGKTRGADFDQYLMLGGRKRCNVGDNGEIRAFYGDPNYKDDGSNGQVMVFQPRFYYQRIPLKTENLAHGTAIRKERIFASPIQQSGFVLHPLFAGDLDYVLLPAYEGALDANNKLTSIAGVKPINNMNPVTAEASAALRGTGWHATTMQAESAMQILQVVELGTLNVQSALERGICDIVDVSGANVSCLTGSTASLGNATGAAAITYFNTNGVETSYDNNGRRAFSYRGVENPWGNIWHVISNILIVGNGNTNGGVPYICSNYSYADNPTNNYTALNFTLSNTSGWASAMALCPEEYNWVFLPIETANTANSAAPIGDSIMVAQNLTGAAMMAVGGDWRFGDSDGSFFYACDCRANLTNLRSYGASLMYIPTKNAIYEANIRKWGETL